MTTLFPSSTLELATQLVELCTQKNILLTTAESCTGGLIAATITDVSGASAIFHKSVVTYSNEMKTHYLGVPSPLFDSHGAVSQPVAEAMAKGAIQADAPTIALSVTGVAGPTGGTPDKPVGTVHIAAYHSETDSLIHEQHHFDGDRTSVRVQSVEAALSLALKLLAA